jgi:hypothetical protein
VGPKPPNIRIENAHGVVRPAIAVSESQKARRKSRTRATGALVWALVLLVCACQLENTGGLQKSTEVEQAFAALQLQEFPGYRYYYLNQENNPFGVAGLAGDFWVKGPDWKECHPDSATFSKVVGLVQSFPVPGSRTEGFYIVDRQGRRIGVWYSSLTAGITVDPDTRKVAIATATPWLQK